MLLNIGLLAPHSLATAMLFGVKRPDTGGQPHTDNRMARVASPVTAELGAVKALGADVE